MRPLLSKSRSMLLAGLPALLLACSDSTAPSNAPVGNHSAIIFVTTPSGGSARNELQAGSSLVIDLKPDGTTTGDLHIAAFGSNPVFDADMAGTWTVSGDVVTFTQADDSFVRNMAFTIQRIGGDVWVLVGDQVFSGTRINLTLAVDS